MHVPGGSLAFPEGKEVNGEQLSAGLITAFSITLYLIVAESSNRIGQKVLIYSLALTVVLATLY